MIEHYAKIALSEIEDVLQHVWVAGPGAPNHGEVLSTGTTPMNRQQAQALALDLSRRSTPAEADSARSNPSSRAMPAPGTWTAITATSSSSPAPICSTGAANANNGRP